MSEEHENLYGDSVLAYSSTNRRGDLVAGKNYERHVLVCLDRREEGCLSRGSFDVKKRFLRLLNDEGLDDVKVSSVNSMGHCDRGPVAVVYPDDVWYGDLTPDAVDEIVASHLLADDPPAEHTFDPEHPDGFQHFLVCTFMANCAGEGGGAVYRDLLSRARDRDDVQVTPSMGCLKECSMAPVCANYPSGDWYTGINEYMHDDIWSSHVDSGVPSKYSVGKTGTD